MRFRRAPEHPWTAALDEPVAPHVAAHVDACPDCARRVAAARAAAEATRAQLEPPPPALAARVLAEVASERARAEATAAAALPSARGPRARRRARRLPAPPRVAAAAAALLLVLAIWGPSIGPLGSPSIASAVPIGPLPVDCSDSGLGALEVAGVWGGAEAEAFAQVLKGFERRTGVSVVYHYETRDIAAKLEERIARGCPPDVALLPQPGLMQDLARRDLIRPLGPAARTLSRAAYAPTWRRMARVGGRLYGVWFKASDKSMLWYRPDALRSAGVDAPPRTWRELRAAATALGETGVAPLAVAGGDGWTLTDWFENVLLRQEGPARYDALARGDLPWTDRGVRRALTRLARLLSDRAAVGDRATVLATSFERSVQRALGPDATAAMVYEGDFVRAFLGRAQERAAGTPEPRIAFADFPAVGRRSAAGSVVGGDVAVRFARSREARRLLRYLATPEAAEAWAERGGFLSPNRLVTLGAYPDSLTRAAALRLSRARVVRFDLSDLQPPGFGSTAGQGMWELFRSLTDGPRVVDRLAARLQREAVAARGSDWR